MGVKMPDKDYATLDALVVVGSLLIVGGGITGLIFFTVPGENLAVVAGLLGTIAGTILGGYAGFRWGASVGRDPQAVEVVNSPTEPVPVAQEGKITVMPYASELAPDDGELPPQDRIAP